MLFHDFKQKVHGSLGNVFKGFMLIWILYDARLYRFIKALLLGDNIVLCYLFFCIVISSVSSVLFEMCCRRHSTETVDLYIQILICHCTIITFARPGPGCSPGYLLYLLRFCLFL